MTLVEPIAKFACKIMKLSLHFYEFIVPKEYYGSNLQVNLVPKSSTIIYKARLNIVFNIIWYFMSNYGNFSNDIEINE